MLGPSHQSRARNPPPEQHEALNDMRRWRTIVTNMQQQQVDPEDIEIARSYLRDAERTYYAQIQL